MALLLTASFIVVGMSAEELKIVQASEIIAKLEKGETIDYSYVEIEGDVNLGGLDLRTAGHISSPIKITDSIINGNINLSNINFNEAVNFERSRFMEPVMFNKAQFKRDVHFDSAQFNEDVLFLGASFNGYSKFIYVKFDKSANFLGANFGAITDFRQAQFKGIANFRLNEFGEAYFEDATFSGPAIFEGAKFNRARFIGSEFKDNVDFDFVQFNESADFIGATFHKKLFFNDAKFKKLTLVWNDIKNGLVCNGPTYLSLIRNFKESEQFEDSDNCYYQYRELKRQSRALGKDNILDYVAWLSCGYGIRLLNTIVTAFIVLVLFATYYESWNIIGFLKNCIFKKNNKTSRDYDFKIKSRNSFYFSTMMLLSLPSEWFPAGKEEFALLLRLHMFSAVLERLIGWGLMLLLIGTLSRLMIRY